MNGLALITVEVTITDLCNTRVAFGGPEREEADAMAYVLAQRLEVAPATDGKLLEVTMTKAELLPILEWLKSHYPQLKLVPLQSRTYDA
jgi:hypothetical protein